MKPAAQTETSTPDGSRLSATYLVRLGDGIADGWNRFWFTPSDSDLVSGMRIGLGVLACWFVLSHTRDLQLWFGPEGILPSETVAKVTTAPLGDTTAYRWSYLDFASDRTSLWLLHGAGILVTVVFASGVATRLTGVMTALVVLSYVHRAPLLTGMWEPLLVPMLFYVAIGPAGGRWSVESWVRRRKERETDTSRLSTPRSVSATVGLRLMQVHLAAFCFAMGAMKLAGDTWWVGEAVWWIVARPDSSWVDLTFLSSTFLLINLWTHAIVLFELTFGILVWVRLLRPLLLCVAWLMWGSLAAATGEIAFFLTLAVASLAFLRS